MAGAATAVAPPRPESAAPSAPDDRRLVVIVIVAAAVAWLLLRVLLISRFPIYGDEGTYATYAQIVESTPSDRFVALNDDKGLIFSWLGAILIHVGASPMGAIRLLTFASGAAITAAMAVTGGWFYGRWTAAVSVVLAAVLPYLVVYSVVGVYDSFVAACAAVAMLLQVLLARRPRLDLALIMGAVLGAGILTKPSGWIAVLLLPFSLLLFDWSKDGLRRRLLAWVGCAAAAGVVVAAMYSLNFLSPIFYHPPVENHHTLSTALDDPWKYFSENFPGYTAGLLGYFTIPVLLAAIVGAVVGLRSRWRETLWLLAWIFPPFVIASLIATTPAPRYLVMLIAPILILAAVGVVWVASAIARLAGAWRALAAAGLAVVMIVPSLVLSLRVVASPNTAPYPGVDAWHYVTSEQLAGSVLDPVADRIRSRSRPHTGVTVVTTNSFGVGALDQKLNGGKYGTDQLYAVTGGVADALPANAQFVLGEDRMIGPYWPDTVLSGLIGGASYESSPGEPDPRFQQLQRRARGLFRLIGRFPRPHNGATVYLYERIPPPAR